MATRAGFQPNSYGFVDVMIASGVSLVVLGPIMVNNKFSMIPFGLNNAPSTFQTLMNEGLSPAEATWEERDFIKNQFPDLSLDDKAIN
ncbi:hypothetical protein WN943_025431 [Citrus x changshan-huyou]